MVTTMKTYEVKILTSANINWESLITANIDNYPWNGGTGPAAGAQLAYVKSGDESEGIYSHIWCCESNPEARYSSHNDPVYLDNCLEFFFTMNAPGKDPNGYINIESNSNPTTLIAYGTNRFDRTPIVDMKIKPFTVRVKKTAERWDLYEFVPFSALKSVFGINEVNASTFFAGNFYKCGGYYGPSYYGTWAPINTPKPDYHRPDKFGRFILVD